MGHTGYRDNPLVNDQDPLIQEHSNLMPLEADSGTLEAPFPGEAMLVTGGGAPVLEGGHVIAEDIQSMLVPSPSSSPQREGLTHTGNEP